MPLMVTKLRLVFSITIAFLSFYGTAQNTYWQKETNRKTIEKNFSKKLRIKKATVFSFNESEFKRHLKGVTSAKSTTGLVYFPDENGELIAFSVSESPVLSPKLSVKYPMIKSYVGHNLKNKQQRIRFSVSQNGVQSMIVSATGKGNVYMQKADKNNYVVYNRSVSDAGDSDFICSTTAIFEKKVGNSIALKPVDSQILRKFRLAISASGSIRVTMVVLLPMH